MRRHLQDLELPLRTARTAALRELLQQIPAPVAATALGFHHTTTQRRRRRHLEPVRRTPLNTGLRQTTYGHSQLNSSCALAQ